MRSVITWRGSLFPWIYVKIFKEMSLKNNLKKTAASWSDGETVGLCNSMIAGHMHAAKIQKGKLQDKREKKQQQALRQEMYRVESC